jgi:hypothetical protein
MSPVRGCSFFSYSQLSLGVEAAAIDVSSAGEAQRVVGPRCHHLDHFPQHRLHEHRFVLVIGRSQPQLSLRSEPACINMPLVGQDERVFSSEGYLFDACLFLKPRAEIILGLDSIVKNHFFGRGGVIFTSCA